MKPRKIIYHGDLSRCKRAQGDAVRMLIKLYESLGINSGQVQVGWKPATQLYTGEVVQLHIGLALDVINIYAPGGEEVIDLVAVEKKIKECPCNCNMSIGSVIGAVLSGTADTLYETVGLTEAPYYIYSVEVCQQGKSYVVFENIIGTDFTPWEVGQKVIVMAYNAFMFSCCTPERLLLPGFEYFQATGCEGIPDTGFIATDENPSPAEIMDDWDWRTSYRILPLCALPIAFWEEK